MNNIKLIATDLDETLISFNKRDLSIKTIKIFEKLKEDGILRVLATGRGVDTIPDQILNLNFDYLITSNGAKVFDNSKNLIYKNIVNQNFINDNKDLFFSDKLKLEIFVDGKPYVSSEYYNLDKPFGRDLKFLEYFKKTRYSVDDMEKFLEENIDNIDNINLIFNDDFKETVINILNEKQKKNDNFTFTQSFPFNLEILGKDVSKGSSLKMLLDKHNIETKNTIAFGDNLNDVSMLSLVYYKGVIAGSLAEVFFLNNKTLEGEVVTTKKPEDDGIYEIISKFVL